MPIGWTSSVADSEFAGSSDCAPDHVTCVVLIASSSIGQRSSAESRVAAVWQNVSIARAIRRWWSLVNFVGREKSTVRTRWRRREPALRLLGQLALLGGLDERGDLIGVEDVAHQAAPAMP